MKFHRGVLYGKLSSRHAVCENWFIDSLSVLQNINEFINILSIFDDPFSVKFGVEDHHHLIPPNNACCENHTLGQGGTEILPIFYTFSVYLGNTRLID
jgi:hypothetical protein